MSKRQPKEIIGSTFAMLDVKLGRANLRRMLEGGACLPITIHGVIDDKWGTDDGVSQEFSVRVTKITTNGRMQPFATVADTKIGDKVITDGGFTCLKENVVRTVRGDKDGLFIACKHKRHYLDGQKDGLGIRYVGLYKA